MTPDTARVTAWVEEIEKALAEASKGPWGLIGGTHDRELIDDHGCHVATTGIFPDAAAIVAAHNALPRLLAFVRGVAELAEELHSEAAEAATWWSTYTGDGLTGPAEGAAARSDACERAAVRLRRLLADAAPDTEKEAGK